MCVPEHMSLSNPKDKLAAGSNAVFAMRLFATVTAPIDMLSSAALPDVLYRDAVHVLYYGTRQIEALLTQLNL